MRALPYRAALRLVLCIAGVSAILLPDLGAQDISGYVVASPNDILVRETAAALQNAPVLPGMPRLDCSIEYIRQFKGKDIVYRRGPIPLHQEGRTAVPASPAAQGSSPAVAEDSSGKVAFLGGILVDLPRAGEAADYLPTQERKYQYMIRAAIVPDAYSDGILRAKIIFERAVVEVSDTRAEVLQSEVFARTVELVGNLPVNLDLPAWEIAKTGDIGTVPPSLEEAVLITLETPRNFGFSRNFPEPFSGTTNISYAVSVPSRVSLKILVNGVETVIDQGRKEPGIHEIAWNAADLPDGSYTATLTAATPDGKPLSSSSMTLTKDQDAPAYTPRRSISFRSLAERFTIATESGIAYQIPVDRAKALRNMFTHIALRAGYRFSPAWEAGLVVGQDAFHEYPGPRVDIERISNYGGVVPYTYGYAGPYLRWTGNGFTVRPAAQISYMFTNGAPLAEVGVGVSATVFSRINLYVFPDVLLHLRTDISAKLGVIYGASVGF